MAVDPWEEEPRNSSVHLAPLCVLRTIELTVLLTPRTFMILFFKTSRNSSISSAKTRVTMSNSPVTSYSSSILSSLASAWTTSSMWADSTKMSTNASRGAMVVHRFRVLRLPLIPRFIDSLPRVASRRMESRVHMTIRFPKDACHGHHSDKPHQRQFVRKGRSEEHTSELQSPCNLVCRLLLVKK